MARGTPTFIPRGRAPWKVQVVASAQTRIPPQTVWTWWTDYGAPGSETLVDHGFSKTWRTIRPRDDGRVEMLERLAIPGRPKALKRVVEIDPAKRTLLETSPSFTATWRFEPMADGTGTRILREITLLGMGRLAPGFVLRRLMEHDLRAHVREMERDIGR